MEKNRWEDYMKMDVTCSGFGISSAVSLGFAARKFVVLGITNNQCS
jgi:hypothetical protein